MPKELQIVFFLATFAALWMVVCFVLSQIGGWGAMAQMYRTGTTPEGESVLTSGTIGWVNYNRCLIVHVNKTGLYLKVFPLFRVGHPPLFIPWSDLSDPKEKRVFWILRMLEMRVGEPSITTIALYLSEFQQRQFRELKASPPPPSATANRGL